MVVRATGGAHVGGGRRRARRGAADPERRRVGLARGSHAAPPARTGGLATTLVALAMVAAVVGGGVWVARDLSSGAPEPLPLDGTASASTRDAPPPAASVEVRIGDDGTLSVVHRVWLSPPTAVIGLSVPERVGATEAFEPRIVDVKVQASGEVRRVASPLRRGAQKTVRLPAGTSSVVVTYRAQEVAVRTEPANPERALALVTPLVVEQAAGLPTTVDVDSVKTLNVGCVGAGGVLAGCGTRTGRGWTVETSGGARYVDVVAQLNLATP